MSVCWSRGNTSHSPTEPRTAAWVSYRTPYRHFLTRSAELHQLRSIDRGLEWIAGWDGFLRRDLLYPSSVWPSAHRYSDRLYSVPKALRSSSIISINPAFISITSVRRIPMRLTKIEDLFSVPRTPYSVIVSTAVYRSSLVPITSRCLLYASRISCTTADGYAEVGTDEDRSTEHRRMHCHQLSHRFLRNHIPLSYQTLMSSVNPSCYIIR